MERLLNFRWAPTLLVLCISCAPQAPTKIQFVFADPQKDRNGLYAPQSAPTFGVSTLDNTLCYAIHVTASDLMVGTEGGDTCADDATPHGLGRVVGMASYGSTFSFDVKVGPARRFDLIGFRKTIRTDLIDSDNLSPDPAPADCPSNLSAALVEETVSGVTRKKVHLYSGGTEFKPQDLFLATGKQDVVPGTNTVVMSLVRDADGSIGTPYHGNCGTAPTAPSGLTYSDPSILYRMGSPIFANVPSSTGGFVDMYSISPPLPSGLTLNTVSGEITGTPASPSASQTYTVTATNSLGFTTATIQIEVVTTPQRIFITSGAFIGNLGGVTGADLLCNTDPAKPTGGLYKALLVTNASVPDRRIACTSPNCGSGGATEHENWIINSNTSYVRADGSTSIGMSDSYGLFTTTLVNSITDTSLYYWSGFNYDTADWTTAVLSGGDDNTCNGWTSDDAGGGHNGKNGDPTFTNFSAFSIQQDYCGDTANPRHLACVEQ